MVNEVNSVIAIQSQKLRKLFFTVIPVLLTPSFLYLTPKAKAELQKMVIFLCIPKNTLVQRVRFDLIYTPYTTHLDSQ